MFSGAEGAIQELPWFVPWSLVKKRRWFFSFFLGSIILLSFEFIGRRWPHISSTLTVDFSEKVHIKHETFSKIAIKKNLWNPEKPQIFLENSWTYFEFVNKFQKKVNIANIFWTLQTNFEILYSLENEHFYFYFTFFEFEKKVHRLSRNVHRFWKGVHRLQFFCQNFKKIIEFEK